MRNPIYCAIALTWIACAGGPSERPQPSPSAGGSTAVPMQQVPSDAPEESAPPPMASEHPIGPSMAPPQLTPSDGTCVSTGTIEATLRPANVLFLIDRSASMLCNLPPITDSASCEQDPARADATQPSKWEVVRAALQTAIAQLPDSASAAITYFSNDDDCGVQSSPHVAMQRMDDAQRSALASSLDAVEPLGGTPIVGGLILAYKQLNPDQTPGQPFGNRFVVLLTDGEEGCALDQTDRLLHEELPKSRTARITTFVIGVPGSEVNRGFLSRLAFAGGAPAGPSCDHQNADPSVGDCQFDMTLNTDLAAGLARALTAISGRALSCEFDVPQPANGGELDHERVNVEYTASPGATGQVIGLDAARPCDGGANGWQYNDDRSKILLCGEACDTVRKAASIRIALGCKSVVVL